jgi:Ca-activated chloride channel family protein
MMISPPRWFQPVVLLGLASLSLYFAGCAQDESPATSDSASAPQDPSLPPAFDAEFADSDAADGLELPPARFGGAPDLGPGTDSFDVPTGREEKKFSVLGEQPARSGGGLGKGAAAGEESELPRMAIPDSEIVDQPETDGLPAEASGEGSLPATAVERSANPTEHSPPSPGGSDADERSIAAPFPARTRTREGSTVPRDAASRVPEKETDNKATVETENDNRLPIELGPGEELWVIARDSKTDSAKKPAAHSDRPGCGALLAELPGRTEKVPVPLKHTSVAGRIDGYIATVDVTQQFQNPFDSKIEAVYVFPLPQDAAVSDFVMTVGERRIRGIIRERDQAEKIYKAARRQGHVASLLTQERPNIFTQKVANIEPGRQIDIQLTYFNTLRYDDSAYEFVFPMVVGPRFNPASQSDGIGAVPRGTIGTSGQDTEVSYLAPHERSGHDVSLTLDVESGVAIENLQCVNHTVEVEAVSESRRRIVLSDLDTIPNRDFVLRYQVAGDQIKSAMMTHEDSHGRYFTMMVYPPKDLETVRRSPMEMVFVLDCSGSMSGHPIEQAKEAIAEALASLTPRDTFQIIRFSSDSSQLGTAPIVATPQNVQRGLQYLASLSGSGGTHMIEGMRAALAFPHDEGRLRVVCFMTDGYIGNEAQILHALSEWLGPTRVFSFGVGQSPNRYLMDRMAGMGRGAVAYLSLNDDACEVMRHFNRRISHPAMTDLSISWGSMQVQDVYPSRLPDLIVGRPIVLTGRFTGEPGVVTVGGRVGMQPATFDVVADAVDAQQTHAGIAAVWARLKIKDLMQQLATQQGAGDELRTLVTQTALDHRLMSAYTAFVAVDSLTRTESDYGTTVAVPVPVPDGVRYETTVGTDDSR